MEATMLERLQSMASAYSEEVKPLLANKGRVVAKRVFNNSKVTDHHAIIPTEERVRLEDLSADERKIYDLIARRFLTLFYPPYKYETIQAAVEVEGETFTAAEKLVLDKGFKKITGREEEEPVRKLAAVK